MCKQSYRIRAIRRKKDISGTEIAAKLGISAQYYYSIERGQRNLSAEMASKLAEIFDVTTDYLLGLSDNPNKEGDKQDGSKQNNFADLDEGVRALAREIQDLDADSQEVLTKLVRSMRKRGKEALDD
ncbi:helix-turn-helix domain-containing protein [Numidum massiliense]|uniref:helix-turn-helix domain-containing protein n=1 Tax=Numidum massiliense TaxID=1522315 RepID=UPI0006D56C47|nr:helix-turn-helix transcriptional regulator [Numidum massiliense]